MIASIGNLGIEQALNYLENEDILAVFTTPLEIVVAWYIYKEIKRVNINLRYLIGSLQRINFKLPLGLAITEYFCAWGLNSFTLYGLSFIVPNYVENQINQEHLTTYIGFLAFTISAIIFAPIWEEILFRGIFFQKIVVKSGIISGVLISASVFAIVHFRYDIVSLFLGGIILVILYLKTKQLIIPIICHFFYNLIVTIRIFYYQFLSDFDHSIPMSVTEYQQDFLDHLGSRILFIALSAPYLIYFIYKNFPRNYDVNKLPYFANQEEK